MPTTTDAPPKLTPARIADILGPVLTEEVARLSRQSYQANTTASAWIAMCRILHSELPLEDFARMLIGWDHLPKQLWVLFFAALRNPEDRAAWAALREYLDGDPGSPLAQTESEPRGPILLTCATCSATRKPGVLFCPVCHDPRVKT